MKRLLKVALLLCPLACIQADELVFQTGFESPTYTTGALSGQGGWSGSVGVVENTFAFAGSQAVIFSGATSGQPLDRHSLSYNSLTDPNFVVDVSVEAYITGHSGEVWEALAVDANTGFAGQIRITTGGDAVFGLASSSIGSVPVALNTWNQFSMLFNFHNDTESAYVNGTLIGTAPFVAPGATALTQMQIGYNDALSASSDKAYFDNVQVDASVPEPSSWLLLGSIVGALGIRGRGLCVGGIARFKFLRKYDA